MHGRFHQHAWPTVHARSGKLTFDTAYCVQVCVIAMLVTGHSAPPSRLHVIKTAFHPEHAERLGCHDPDCLHPKGTCKGNRRVTQGCMQWEAARHVHACGVKRMRVAWHMEHGMMGSTGFTLRMRSSARHAAAHHAPGVGPRISMCGPQALCVYCRTDDVAHVHASHRLVGQVDAEGASRAIYIAPHHKCDRIRDSIVYTIPFGPLTDLLLIHIDHGHAALEERLGPQPHLFFTRAGKPFSNATFTQYWSMVLDGHWLDGLGAFRPKFPPSQGRNIFCEYVTSITG